MASCLSSSSEFRYSELEERVNLLKEYIVTTFESISAKLAERRALLLSALESIKQDFMSKVDAERKEEEDYKHWSVILEQNVKNNTITELMKEPREKIKERISGFGKADPTFDYTLKVEKLDFLIELISNFGCLQSSFRDYTLIENARHSFGEGNDMVSPRGLAVDYKDRIFVSDTNKHSIFVYTIKGVFLAQFGSQLLSEPWGVCCAENKLFVTDKKKHCVVSFDLSNFTVFNKTGSLGTRNAELNSPTAIDFDTCEKEIYVADYLNNRIAIYDTNLIFKRFLLDKSIQGPICLKLTEKRIFILECRTPQLRSYSKDGTDQNNHFSTGKDQMVETMLFFTVDKKNNCILSDFGNNCIRVIDETGVILKTTREGKKRGEDGLYQPTGICFSHSGDALIVVTQQKHSPILIF